MIEQEHLGSLAGISKNTEVIRRTIDAGFDVITILDLGIPHQQNLERPGIGLVLIAHNEPTKSARRTPRCRRGSREG